MKKFVENLRQRLMGCEFNYDEAQYLIDEIRTRTRYHILNEQTVNYGSINKAVSSNWDLCMDPSCHLMREHSYADCGSDYWKDV